MTPRTKVIFISHVTSPTALIFPVKEICQRIDALTGLFPICSEGWFGQFFAARLPESTDPAALHQHLYMERSIVAPYTQLNNHKFIRVSFQGRNSEKDADTLVNALDKFINR